MVFCWNILLIFLIVVKFVVILICKLGIVISLECVLGNFVVFVIKWNLVFNGSGEESLSI